MTDEILKLARECGFDLAMESREYDLTLIDYKEEIEAFYRAAFNAGLEAGVVISYDMGLHFGKDIAGQIRASIKQIGKKELVGPEPRWPDDIEDTPVCCVCGTTQGLHKDGTYGYRCDSDECVPY